MYAGVVLILGASDWQRAMLRAELVRLCPQLDPGAKPLRRGGRKKGAPAGSGGAMPAFAPSIRLLGTDVAATVMPAP